MSANTRLLAVELVLYSLAMWLSYELAKAPEQRLYDRLRAYAVLARCCYRTAATFGRLGMSAELAYRKEATL